MLTEDQARHFADEWVAAWNSHDLDRILAHWRDDCEFTSPVAAQLMGNPVIVGKEALRAYWARGLEAFPDLHFDMKTVFTGVDSVVLGYTNHKGQQVAEVVRLDADGQAFVGTAHYFG